MTPAPATRTYVLGNDRPFAEQVGAHNKFGADHKCWN